MTCQLCDSDRVAEVGAKCNDLCYINLGETDDGAIMIEYEGYVPHDMNIGGGDYLRIEVCLDCGIVQGEWPLPFCELEESYDEEEGL